MEAEVSEQIRKLWLAGVSSVRIASILDIGESSVRAEARRLGLPLRRKRKIVWLKAGSI
jgi:hypothetical protein